jgi:HEAT repeat protein
MDLRQATGGAQLASGPGDQSQARKALESGGKPAVPVLIELLGTEASPGWKKPSVRWIAAEVLGTIGPDARDASASLLSALDDPDTYVQGVAAFSIPQVQTPAKDAVPPLTKLLRTQHVVPATRAPGEYKGEAKAALTELLVILQDESRPTEDRWNAARTIGKIGPAAIESLPVLIELTKDKEATIREHCAEAIGDVGPTAVDGIPALIECLDDPATRVRRDSVRSLGYIGEASAPAVPKILKLLTDKEELVRHAARDALRIIAPDELAEWDARHKAKGSSVKK